MPVLTFDRVVSAPPPHIYRAFLSDIVATQWLCDIALIQEREGGAVFYGWNEAYSATGRFTRLTPNEHIAFTWQGTGEPTESTVTIDLTPEGDSTRMKVSHVMPEHPAWAEALDGVRDGWESGFEALEYMLKTGLDLRLMRRPMLGVYPNQLSPEEAAKRGIAEGYGLLLNGVVDGMSAQAAGLQADDIILRIDGHAIRDYASLRTSISSKIAGDTVSVDYIREGARHTLLMPLASRPVPESFASADALADALHSRYFAAFDEIAALLADVPESVCEQRPASDEWSVNEVLSHLIWTERYNQIWLVGIRANRDIIDWADNNPTHLVAALTLYPSASALLDGYRRELEATIATGRSLPSAIFAQKGLWNQVEQYLSNLNHHMLEHKQQIQQTLTQLTRVS